MQKPPYTYEQCVENSIRVSWDLDEILPLSTHLDFSKPHLPETLTGIEGLGFLNQREKLALNHIRGYSYMNLFAFVEEFILAQMVTHAQTEMFGDHTAIRALLRFSEEEIKHQDLFKRYGAFFLRDFGSPVEVLKSAVLVAQIILAKSPLAVLLITYHIELMTQQHYVDCIRDQSAQLDPLFGQLLKYHWLEEAQHAKIDHLEIYKLTQEASAAFISQAMDDYIDILSALDELVKQQASMDCQSLQQAVGREFSPAELTDFMLNQHQSYRKDFVLAGVQNASFKQVLLDLSTQDAGRVLAEAEIYALPLGRH